MVVGDGQPHAAAAGDDEVHDRPGQTQAARLAPEAAHHLRAPLDLAQRSFEQTSQWATIHIDLGIRRSDIPD